MTGERLAVSGRALGPSFDLLAAFGWPSGFFMERAGLGVATRGVATRIVVPGGPGQVARGAASVRAAWRGLGDDVPAAPIAVGAFPFAGDLDAEIVIPERAVRRGATKGETWEVLSGRDAGEDHGYERVVGMPDPHEAFGDVQLRPVPSPEAYEYGVASALDLIGTTDLKKVVLARTVEVDANRALDARQLVHRLRAVDRDCFAFAVPAGPGKTLVGATPELLISRRGLEVRSNPLAGSAPRSGDPDEDRANAEELGRSPKERQEHAMVVEVVFRALRPLCEEITFDREPQLFATANVWHLSTRFAGTLRTPAPDALELVAALHPTPAVCGEPRDEALRVIGDLEPFDRGLYAGPVGWVDRDGDGDWAIALRCAELSGDHARLFAGAGIVDLSDPERELDETERKFRAFLDSLRWG